jgi:hypothetical protein
MMRAPPRSCAAKDQVPFRKMLRPLQTAKEANQAPNTHATPNRLRERMQLQRQTELPRRGPRRLREELSPWTAFHRHPSSDPACRAAWPRLSYQSGRELSPVVKGFGCRLLEGRQGKPAILILTKEASLFCPTDLILCPPTRPRPGPSSRRTASLDMQKYGQTTDCTSLIRDRSLRR